MMFALASALRLARFNAAIDDDKPKWQSNYFTGMPTPAAAIVVLLPVYVHHLGLESLKSPLALKFVLVYVLFIAFMMVSTIPTYSGKLLGERVGREWVLPMFIVAIGSVAMLATYPYETLSIATAGYLLMIPVSWKRFKEKSEETAAAGGDAAPATAPPVAPQAAAQTSPQTSPQTAANDVAASEAVPAPSGSPVTGKVFPLRPGEPAR